VSRSFRLIVASALGGASLLAAPAIASASICPDVPVLGQACEAAETGVGTATSVGEAGLSGPLPGVGFASPVTEAVGGAVGGVAKEAISAVTAPIFNQIASVTTDAASWLVGKVAALVSETTSPDLMSPGFLARYRQMAEIAALLGAVMLLAAVLEGIARGDLALLGRAVLVNLPLAFLATSFAYVAVAALLGFTDQLCGVFASSSGHDAHGFLRSSAEAISKAGASVGGAPGAVGAPVFAVIIAALLAIVAGFFVWIELVARDAGLYVVSLFLPLALAASIWPRWSGALRRTAELLVALIGSKFVIVVIVSLAAGLLSHGDGRFEQMIAAAALLLLACFSPIFLLRLVPFAEGAMASAYARRSGAGMAASGVQLAGSAQMVRASARRNWGGGGSGLMSGSSASGGGGSSAGGGGGNGAGPAGSSGAGGASAAGASGGAAAAMLPVSAAASTAKAGRAGAERLASTAAGGGAPSEADEPPPEPQAPRRPPTESAGKGAPRPSAPAAPPRPPGGRAGGSGGRATGGVGGPGGGGAAGGGSGGAA
jgi:hypothetical protein